jgi:hypothetical protein
MRDSKDPSHHSDRLPPVTISPELPDHVPADSIERPKSSPLHDKNEEIDPELPPEPGNDINP